MAASSSVMRARALLILSSSPRLLGSIAKVIEGSGISAGVKAMGCAGSQMLSPVVVSYNLVTAKKSPACTSPTGSMVLPWGICSGPNFSLFPLVWLLYVVSERIAPE